MKPDKRDVLVTINNLRVEQGLAPLETIPHGRPRHSRYCPIAKALSRPGEQVSVVLPEYTSGSGPRRLPLVLRQFVCAFDDLRYPELVDGRHPAFGESI